MTNPIQPDRDRALRAMRKIKQLQADAAELEEAINNLKDVVAANLPTGETIIGSEDEGYMKATVYVSKQYNEAYGRNKDPELWTKYAIPELVLTSARAKSVLTAEEYAVFQKPSAKVSVKVETVND